MNGLLLIECTSYWTMTDANIVLLLLTVAGHLQSMCFGQRFDESFCSIELDDSQAACSCADENLLTVQVLWCLV